MTQEEDRVEKECKRINDRVLVAVKNQLGKQWADDITNYIKPDMVGAFYFGDEPIGDYVEENYIFNGAYVDQYSVGDSGDSFAGTICIELKPNMFLKFDYSC